MSLPTIGDAAALGVRLGRTLIGDDQARAEAVLADVSALARKTSGDSDRWVDTSVTPNVSNAPDDVVAVVLAAARRLFVNPDQYASEQDGDYSYRIDASMISGGVFTGPERAVLASYQSTPGLWTMSLCGSDQTSFVNDSGVLERFHGQPDDGA